MKYIFILLVFYSCTPFRVMPLKNTYAEKPFEQTVNKSKEVVWENIIDFFAKNGLSIKIIDKSSGLIISDKTTLKWTYELKDGKLEFPHAWVAVPKVINTGNNMPQKYLSVFGDWNVRIKETTEGTLINVNLVNINCFTNTYQLGSTSPASVPVQGVKSTGVFEKMIYDNMK